MTREEYPTPTRPTRGTSPQRAGGAASRREDGGEWTREPAPGPVRAACRRYAEDGWHRGRTDLSSRLYRRDVSRLRRKPGPPQGARPAVHQPPQDPDIAHQALATVSR